MKKVLLTLVVVAAFLVSCGGGMNAVDFNDSVVGYQKEIMTISTSFINKIQVASETENFEQIKVESDSALLKIDEVIAKVKDMKAPSDGEDMKNAAVEAFESYKKVVEEGAKASVLNKDSKPEELNSILENLNKVGEEADKVEQKLLDAQKEFAKKNKIIII